MNNTLTQAEARTAKDSRYMVTKYFYDGFSKGITIVDKCPKPFPVGFMTKGYSLGSPFIVLNCEETK